MSMTWHYASLAGAAYPRQTDRTILNADPRLAGAITADDSGSSAVRLTAALSERLVKEPYFGCSYWSLANG